MCLSLVSCAVDVQALDLRAVVFQKEQELRLRQAEAMESRKVRDCHVDALGHCCGPVAVCAVPERVVPSINNSIAC